MAEQVQKKRTRQKDAEAETVKEPTSQEKTDALKAELDDLLEEIDTVLERNADEFVRGYVQKGGQ